MNCMQNDSEVIHHMEWYKRIGVFKLIKKLKRKIKDLKISLRIALFYFIVMIISLFISSLLYRQIYMNIAHQKVNEASVQTLYSIKSNVDLFFDNVNNYSKMILSDHDLQTILRKGNIYSDLNTQSKVGGYIYRMIQMIQSISSVYIFDNSENYYVVSEQLPIPFTLESIKKAKWYKEVLDKKGAYVLSINGDGAFEIDPNGNYISMIRLIRDIDNTQNLGVLVINIPDTAFKECYANIVDNYKNTSITFWDKNRQCIVPVNHTNGGKQQVEPILNEVEIKSLLSKFDGSAHGYMTKKIINTEYLISFVNEERHNWTIISAIPFSEVSYESEKMGFVGFVTILLNSIILFMGTIIISRWITVPIHKLLKSMNAVKRGEFKEVNINEGNNEIGQLRDGYNMMIREIQNLINRVIDEQKTIRKAELNVLQAQIKPHFLYNTLDSITSLALSGRINEVCDLVDALGGYYRHSVSKGREIITLREELDIVKNYLKIQKVRYEDMFEVNYNIEESCLDTKILKLVLQPLVENALYHGIRAKGVPGVINISIKKEAQQVCISIEDDGVGMSDYEIQKILDSKVGSAESSFGLRGTIERLKIYCNNETAFQLYSEKGKGTKIIILLPLAIEGEIWNKSEQVNGGNYVPTIESFNSR